MIQCIQSFKSYTLATWRSYVMRDRTTMYTSFQSFVWICCYIYMLLLDLVMEINNDDDDDDDKLMIHHTRTGRREQVCSAWLRHRGGRVRSSSQGPLALACRAGQPPRSDPGRRTGWRGCEGFAGALGSRIPRSPTGHWCRVETRTLLQQLVLSKYNWNYILWKRHKTIIMITQLR